LSRVADPKESRVRANMHHDTTDQISTTTNNASSAAPLIINCLLTAEIKLVHYLVIAIAYIANGKEALDLKYSLPLELDGGGCFGGQIFATPAASIIQTAV
jgi:hypothetical protein